MPDLKVNYKNKYKHDLTCRICRVEDETLEHIFQCKAYEKESDLKSDFSHLWIYSEVSKTVEIIENIPDVRDNTSRKKNRKEIWNVYKIEIVGTTS